MRFSFRPICYKFLKVAYFIQNMNLPVNYPSKVTVKAVVVKNTWSKIFVWEA